jgi:hypothetical protein
MMMAAATVAGKKAGTADKTTMVGEATSAYKSVSELSCTRQNSSPCEYCVDTVRYVTLYPFKELHYGTVGIDYILTFFAPDRVCTHVSRLSVLAGWLCVRVHSY